MTTHDAGRDGRERHASYTGDRSDLLSLLPALQGPVLDVGCSSGAVGRRIQQDFGVPVTGIERSPMYARQAGEVLHRVVEADAVEGMRALHEEQRSFSAVVLADILEHLEDPWAAFDLAVSLTRPGGWVLVSIPNVGHWSTLASLLAGRWPRRSRGIHDSTHLRFFARRDLDELMNRGHARLVRYRRIYRIRERPHKLNRWAVYVAWMAPDLFTYQFYLLSQVCEADAPPLPPARIRPWTGSSSIL